MTEDHDNNRETGARKYPPEPSAEDRDKSQQTVRPQRKKPYGLTQSVEETNEKTHQSDGQDMRVAADAASVADPKTGFRKTIP